MAVLPILTGEDTAILRKKAQMIPAVTKDIKRIIKSMHETVKDAEGLGLAAPQIGQSIRLCLASFTGKMNPMINPEVTWSSEETNVMDEGCLSLPGKNVDVSRPVEVTVIYLDEYGQEHERRLHDLDARVVQHEIDHLNGILIVDYQ